MVMDSLQHIDRYTAGSASIAAALHAMAEMAQKPDLADGTYTIIPDEVIVHVLTKQTRPVSEAQMEIHAHFMDIHCMLDGAERCGVAPLAENVVVDPQTDNGFYACENAYDVLIGEGEFYMVWPFEPHRPLCNSADTVDTVRKMIAKVRI